MAGFTGFKMPTGKLPRFTAPAHFYSYNIFKFFYLAAVLGLFITPTLAEVQLEHNVNVFQNGDNVCVQDYDPTLDYFPFKVVADESDMWDVQYFNSYKIARNKALNHTYVLYQCGTPRPTPNLSDYTDDPNANVQYMTVPRVTLAVDETVPLTMLEILGYTRAIKYINNATTQYVTSPCIQRIIEQNPEIALSDDPAKQAEQLANVSLHIASPWTPSPAQNKVIFSATEDPGTLERSEWIDFLAIFFNLEEEAGLYSKGVRDRYEDLTAQAGPRNPKLTVAYITAYNGTYTIDEAAFKQEYMTNAGGNPLKGGDFTNLTAFHDAVRAADVVIDEAYWEFDKGVKTFQDFLDIYNITPDAGKFKFVENRNVYGIDGRVNPRGWLDWYEGAVIRADLVLRDFVSVLQTEDIPQGNSRRIWLRRLDNETQTVVTADDCTALPALTPSLEFIPTTTLDPEPTIENPNTQCQGDSCSDNNPDSSAAAVGVNADTSGTAALMPLYLPHCLGLAVAVILVVL